MLVSAEWKIHPDRGIGESPHGGFPKSHRGIQNGWLISWKIRVKWKILGVARIGLEPPHGLETKSSFFVESESSMLKYLKSEFPWLNPLPSGNLTIWKLTNFSSLWTFTYKNMIIVQFNYQRVYKPPTSRGGVNIGRWFFVRKIRKVTGETNILPMLCWSLNRSHDILITSIDFEVYYILITSIIYQIDPMTIK